MDIKEEPLRRMVVFLGPHKSASTSVQSLFVEYASSRKNRNRHSHHPSLRNWTWPFVRHGGDARKTFAPLVTEKDVKIHQPIFDAFLDVWKNQDNNGDNSMLSKPNIIWGSEELDRFGSTPWSHRDGIQAIDKVWNLLLFNSTSSTLESLKASSQQQHQQGNLQGLSQIQVDMVVNYRRPRSDQWISIWKQLYRKKKDEKLGSYTQFMCATEEYERIWEYLDCAINPYGLVEILLDNFSATAFRNAATIHVLDMQGIARRNKDAGHILACEVLNVPCSKNQWLPGIDEPILENTRSRDSGLTKEQLEDMDWVLLQRDCLFKSRLRNVEEKTGQVDQHQEQRREQASLVFHYADYIWDSCSLVTSTESPSQFSNTSFLFEVLQSQVGCGPLPAGYISHLRRVQEDEKTKRFHDFIDANFSNAAVEARSNVPTLRNNVTNKELYVLFEETPQFDISSITRIAEFQHLIMRLIIIMGIVFLIQRRLCRKKKTCDA